MCNNVVLNAHALQMRTYEYANPLIQMQIYYNVLAHQFERNDTTSVEHIITHLVFAH